MSTIHDDPAYGHDTFSIIEAGPPRLIRDRFARPLLRPLGVVCIAISMLALFPGLLIGSALLSHRMNLVIDLSFVLTWVSSTPWSPAEATWVLLGSAVLLQGCAALMLLPKFSRIHMVLFLRKFRHTNASQTVSDAASRTGANWRFVSLDDTEMEPTGGSRGLLATTLVIGYLPMVTLTSGTVGVVSKLVKMSFKIAIFAWVMGVILHWFTEDVHLIAELTKYSGYVVAAVIGAWAIKWVLIAVFSLPVLLVMSIVTMNSNEWAKATNLSELKDIRAEINPKQIGQTFAAKFRVVEVGIEFWRTAVSSVSVIATLPLIDVSEPTDAILWEVAEMISRFGSRCVFIGHRPQVEAFISSDDPIAARLHRLLAGKEVLVYVNDTAGRRRFAHALRATLEFRSRQPLGARDQSDPLEDLGSTHVEPDQPLVLTLAPDRRKSTVIVRSYTDADHSVAYQAVEALSEHGIECEHIEDGSPTVWELDTKFRIESSTALVLALPASGTVAENLKRDLDMSRPRGIPVVLVAESGPALEALQPEGSVYIDGSRFQQDLIERVRGALAKGREVRSGELAGSGLPVRNPFFKGREDTLRQLAADVQKAHGSAVTQICGEGGVGKTEIAAEFVYRFRSDYDFIGWLDASCPAALPQQLAQIAQFLEVEAAADTPLRTVTQAVLEALAATDNRWCLVLDGLSEESELSRRLLSGGGGHVIVTSRTVAGERSTVIAVGPLPRHDNVALLRTRARGLDPGAAESVCEVLGDRTFAVDQAGAFIAQSGMPAQRYLARLNDTLARLRTERQIEPASIEATAVWTVTHAHLNAHLRLRSRKAVRLLELCSFLGTAVMTPSHFTSNSGSMPAVLRLGGAIRYSQAVDLLTQYGLVKNGHIRGSMIPNGSTAEAIRHRITRQNEDAYSRYAQIAATAMMEALGGQPMKAGILYENPSNRSRWGLLLPHVVSILSHLPADHREEQTMALAVRASDYLRQQELLAPAIAILENALLDLRRFKGDGYHRTRDVRGKLAEAYGAECNQPDDVALTSQLLDHRQTTLGEGFPGELNARRSKARRLKEEGRHEAAIELYEEVIRVRRRVFGEDHDHTLGTRNDLALVHSRNGNTDAAIAILEDVMNVRQQSGTNETKGALIALSNLASAYTDADQFEQAVATHERVLCARWRLLGEEHPDTLVSLNNFAFTLERIGHDDTALTLFAHVFAVRRRTLGIDHPDTLSSQDNFKHVHELRQSSQREVNSSVGSPAKPDQDGSFHAYRRLSARLPEALRADLLSSLSDLSMEMAALGLLDQACVVVTEGIEIQQLLEQEGSDRMARVHADLRATLIKLCKRHHVEPTPSIIAAAAATVARLGELASEAPQVHANAHIEAMEVLITLKGRGC